MMFSLLVWKVNDRAVIGSLIQVPAAGSESAHNGCFDLWGAEVHVPYLWPNEPFT